MIFGVAALVWLGTFLLLLALVSVALAVTVSLDGLHYPENTASAVMSIFLSAVFVMLALKCFGIY